MHLDLDNVEGPAGDYAIAVRSEGLNVVGSGAPQTVRLNARQRSAVTVPLDGIRQRHRERDRAHQRPERLCDRAQLRARRQAGDADSRAAHGQAAGERREPDVVERSVRRSGARHRPRRAVGRAVDRARRRRAARGARPLSVRLLRADRQPGAAAALRQRSRVGGASGARHRRRSAHPRVDRPAAGPPGLERLVRAVVGGRRRRLARRLCHRLPDPGAREELRRSPTLRSSSRSNGCATSSAMRRTRPRTAAAISPMRSTCWRATARRRSATCATTPTPSSTTSRPRSPRRSSPPRWRCSATARAPSASTPRRSPRSTSRRRTRAAATTARCCAMPPRW